MLKSYLSNPPHFFKAYKSNINRAPRKKFFKITKAIYYYLKNIKAL